MSVRERERAVNSRARHQTESLDTHEDHDGAGGLTVSGFGPSEECRAHQHECRVAHTAVSSTSCATTETPNRVQPRRTSTRRRRPDAKTAASASPTPALTSRSAPRCVVGEMAGSGERATRLWVGGRRGERDESRAMEYVRAASERRVATSRKDLCVGSEAVWFQSGCDAVHSPGSEAKVMVAAGKGKKRWNAFIQIRKLPNLIWVQKTIQKTSADTSRPPGNPAMAPTKTIRKRPATEQAGPSPKKPHVEKPAKRSKHAADVAEKKVQRKVPVTAAIPVQNDSDDDGSLEGDDGFDGEDGDMVGEEEGDEGTMQVDEQPKKDSNKQSECLSSHSKAVAEIFYPAARYARNAQSTESTHAGAKGTQAALRPHRRRKAHMEPRPPKDHPEGRTPKAHC